MKMSELILILIIIGIGYLFLTGKTDIEITNKDKGKKYEIHCNKGKCTYESTKIKKKK